MISKGLFLRVKESLNDKQNGPYCIDLVVSDYCNFRCLYCSGSLPHSHKSNWSRGVLTKTLDAAMKLHVQEISLTSLIGEPTVFKDIKYLMEEIKKRDFVGTLLTNGSTLDLGLAEFMKKIEWDVLIISLDSFDPGIQYKLRPGLDKKNYLEKVIEFLDFTAEHNTKLNVNLNMVVNNLNYKHVYDYFKKAQSYGVKNITLLKLANMNDNYERFILNDAQKMEFKDMLKNMNTPIYFNSLEWLGGHNVNAGHPDTAVIKTEARKDCYFHLYKILIDCNGQVVKCNGDPQETQFNVNDDDLYDIYYNLLDTYKDLRTDASCWEICCSPIKALNQEIGYYLAKGMAESKNEAPIK